MQEWDDKTDTIVNKLMPLTIFIASEYNGFHSVNINFVICSNL